MPRQILNTIRIFLGDISIAVGALGFLLFSFTVPLTFFGAHFWGAFGYREGAQPTPEQLAAAVNHQLHWSVWHRLVPQLVISIALLAYGLYEASRAAKHKTAQDAAA
jgi:hypothetical protein